MTDIKNIDIEKNKVTFDDFDEVTPEKFMLLFQRHLTGFVAGETLNPFDMERFMKRGSSKNLKQLCDGKKAEGFDEASLGKKMDAGMMRFLLIMLLVVGIAVAAVVVLKALKIF
jgi:hypothetical protein